MIRYQQYNNTYDVDEQILDAPAHISEHDGGLKCHHEGKVRNVHPVRGIGDIANDGMWLCKESDACAYKRKCPTHQRHGVGHRVEEALGSAPAMLMQYNAATSPSAKFMGQCSANTLSK